jgi:hypothetical protein
MHVSRFIKLLHVSFYIPNYNFLTNKTQHREEQTYISSSRYVKTHKIMVQAKLAYLENLLTTFKLCPPKLRVLNLAWIQWLEQKIIVLQNKKVG